MTKEEFLKRFADTEAHEKFDEYMASRWSKLDYRWVKDWRGEYIEMGLDSFYTMELSALSKMKWEQVKELVIQYCERHEHGWEKVDILTENEESIRQLLILRFYLKDNKPNWFVKFTHHWSFWVLLIALSVLVSTIL